MAVSQSFEVHREPVGKRTVAAIMLADAPDGNASGHRPRSPRGVRPGGTSAGKGLAHCLAPLDE